MTKEFGRFARREGIPGEVLCDAIDRAERGLVDADLGGGLIKQRVARPGQGRRGGYRTIIVYRRERRSLFVMGFGKSELDNIGDDDLARLKAFAAQVQSWSDAQIGRLLDSKEWQELA
jgi:hypothetical protein